MLTVIYVKKTVSNGEKKLQMLKLMIEVNYDFYRSYQ